MGTVRYTVIDGEVVSENRNGALLDYVPDPLGSTVAMLNNMQTVTDTFTYWPYGEVVNRSGTTPTQFQYVGTKGYYKDNASTNVKTYVRNRYLDHAKCRWLTQDPLGFAGGDYNLYRYVRNNPMSAIDPAGTSNFLVLPILPPVRVIMPVYGYWCGPQTVVPPVPVWEQNNEIDYCCMQHDLNWAQAEVPCTWKGQCVEPCKTYTQWLCQCVEKRTCWWELPNVGSFFRCQAIKTAIMFYACRINLWCRIADITKGLWPF